MAAARRVAPAATVAPNPEPETSAAAENDLESSESLAARLQLRPRHAELILRLPGTRTVRDVKDRFYAFHTLCSSLQAGCLPDAQELAWPAEPLRSAFLSTAGRLQLPRFTHVYPEVLATVLRHFLDMVQEFEENVPPQDDSPQQQESSVPDPTQQQDQAREEQVQSLTEELIEKFEKEWEPAMENLEAAQEALDDVDPLMDGEEGFDPGTAIWKRSGWREVASLSARLARMRPLQRLIAELGRGTGLGPFRRGPTEVHDPGSPLGVTRDESAPTATTGLTRSGQLSRALPSELFWLAQGAGDSEPTGTEGLLRRQEDRWKEPRSDGQTPNAARIHPPKTAPGKRLFSARLLERTLLSYERAGWVDDLPTRVLSRRELRPLAARGPVLLCLDTSGSMAGEPESVAKALTLECARAAARQGRRCVVFAFSGSSEVRELELGLNRQGLMSLLDFLDHSFHGGTEVDAPLQACLDRLSAEEWRLADVLMVTDGQFSPPGDGVVAQLAEARRLHALRAHCLVVGSRVTEAARKFATDTHLYHDGALTSFRCEPAAGC